MPSKGNQYLIEAAPKVLARHPNARFFIVGEGELQPELEAQAKALGLGDRLVFAGFHTRCRRRPFRARHRRVSVAVGRARR